jgi:protein-L-isoaspartate(D-aspartate) O-methyltransferase
MNKKYSAAIKRWFWVSLIFLIPFLFVGAGPCACPGQPHRVASTEYNRIDANQVLAELEQKEPNRPQHKHPAFKERIDERMKMVAQQIQARDVDDPNVLRVMRIVPRHIFVRPGDQSLAYIDSPLPIDYEQTISQPYIVGFMTEALQLDPNSRVLEIGTGSGYQAAVCAEIAKEVYTIEIVKELAGIAKERLKELDYPNVFVKAGDGFFGWPEHAPFDAIIGTAAAGQVPEPLVEQLKPGGRMILPIGGPRDFQYLVLMTKDDKGNLDKKIVMPVRFVPMTGEVEKPKKESNQELP